MPETVAAASGAFVLVALLVAACAASARFYGTGAVPDPAAPLWQWIGRPMRASADEERRRRRLFRRRDAGITEAPEFPPEPDAPAPEPEEEPRLRPTRPALDYVPLGEDSVQQDEEGKARFRERFRKGLRKTRDVLNRDVREVFGSGPIASSFEALEEALIKSDVGVATATALSDDLREREGLATDTLMPALKETMRGLLKESDRRLRVNREGPSVWLVVGVNGTGKTTSIAKLANHAKRQGFHVCLAAADTFRAAAIEQLETWGERIGVEVVRQQAGSDPGAVVFDAVARAKARGYDLVLVDTAGRLHTRKPLMEELRKVRRVAEREEGILTETLLVIDATTGQNGVTQARAFGEAVDVTGLVLAKLDGTAKGGIVFAVERELDIPVKAVGLGEGLEDLAPFDPDAFVEALFEASGDGI